MYQINEFNNSKLGQSIAAEKQDKKDGKIMTIVTGIMFVLLVIVAKHAFGG